MQMAPKTHLRIMLFGGKKRSLKKNQNLDQRVHESSTVARWVDLSEVYVGSDLYWCMIDTVNANSVNAFKK